MSVDEIIASAELSHPLPDRYRLDVHAKLYRLGGNQRPYFSVTADLLNLRRSGDNRYEACGCLHDDVLRYFPKLTPVVALHLADDRGVPMHATENGAYWLGYTQYPDVRNLATFAKLWRVTEHEAGEADRYVRDYVQSHVGDGRPSTIVAKDAVAVLFLAMLDRWQTEADEAVRIIREVATDG